MECGAELRGATPAGLCPACALRDALDARGAPAAATSAQSPDGEPERLRPATGTSLPGPGTRIGDYELLEEIGRGGMGVVHRARHVSLARVVAVKMLLPGVSSPESLQRFRTEASTAAGLHHPHIVAIHDVGVWHGQPYFVMDHVEGVSLARRIADARAGVPDLPRAARWLKAIAEAVQYAHDRGILHRDLKPSNVMIDERGEPRVTDFGLAKRVDERSHLTLSGQALGSPSYMPPEQAESGSAKVSRRSDVYGLGATLYHVLTGRAPFEGDTPTDVLHQVLTSEPPAPRALNPAIPRDLETICLRCLEKDPGRRYASAQMVAEELGRVLDGQPIVARPVGAPERLWRWCRRKPLAAALTTALAVSLLTAGWLGWQARLSSRQLEQERTARAIDTALAAAWGGDRAAAERAIAQAERHGAPAEWIRVLHGQVALYSFRIDEAVAHFEQAVALAPQRAAARAMLANAYLWRGELDRYVEELGRLGELAPETPEDHLFLGSALIMGHPDTSKAVSLLEIAKQKRPSGITFILLGMAEGFRALDTGSWPTAEKAMDHVEGGIELLGPDHPELLAPVESVYNVAMRRCPPRECAGVRAKAAGVSRALASVASPQAHIQRAFYFENTGDMDAEIAEWRKVASLNRIGLCASWYAAAMLQRARSVEALDVLMRPSPSGDPIGTVARAYLLLDGGRVDEAKALYRQASERGGATTALAETVLLLAGERGRVSTNATRLLDAVPRGHPDHQALQYWAGRASADDLVSGAGSSRVAQCRQRYLVAVTRLADGDRAAAREHFRRCVETGLQPMSEYQWSRAFLARLDRDPHWPPWIPS
jgi:tetratricopeptide (TPR) repeat protein